ncbi:hypothetical protein RRG08_038502 [Elysia crispata]|uniref:Uncharacterized protein n=1 Tax=Elysia crispata TaxID=231223 RepID=A0AAE1DZY8_9GAST|nr:hypothetical protein RRG08_038502 [Elysia crispata]
MSWPALIEISNSKENIDEVIEFLTPLSITMISLGDLVGKRGQRKENEETGKTSDNEETKEATTEKQDKNLVAGSDSRASQKKLIYSHRLHLAGFQDSHKFMLNLELVTNDIRALEHSA